MDNFSYNQLMKDIENIKTYNKMPGKFNFQPVNIEWIRANLWNNVDNKWKPLKYYWSNGDNPNNPIHGPVMVLNVHDRNKNEKVFCSEYTFDGDLLEYDMINGLLKNKKVYKGWLNSNAPGPYKWKGYDYNNNKKYFYLSGVGQFCGYKDKHNFPLQICKCNYISDKCISGLNWIEVS